MNPATARKALKDRMRRQTIRVWYEDMMKGQACSFCGESRRAALDWHHTDARFKDGEISRMVNTGVGIPKIQQELAKCIPLCSNCHRVLHAEEREEARERRKAA